MFIVGDCPLQQLHSSVLLSRCGIQTILASDGLKAVLLAGKQHFDLILMDIRMGVLNGVVATQRIRQNERRVGTAEVPIVAHTAEPLATNRAAWAAAGITPSLAKPCKPAEMSECLKQWCVVQLESQQHCANEQTRPQRAKCGSTQTKS